MGSLCVRCRRKFPAKSGDSPGVGPTGQSPACSPAPSVCCSLSGENSRCVICGSLEEGGPPVPTESAPSHFMFGDLGVHSPASPGDILLSAQDHQPHSGPGADWHPAGWVVPVWPEALSTAPCTCDQLAGGLGWAQGRMGQTELAWASDGRPPSLTAEVTQRRCEKDAGQPGAC